MGKYIKQVGNEQGQVTARGKEDSSLLGGGLLSEMFAVAEEQAMLDNIASAATSYFRATLDRLTRKNPSADVSRLERISYSLTIRTMRRRLDGHIKTLFVCACDCWNAIKQKGKRRIRRIVGRVRRSVVSATGLFRASSAEAASRHRESDDAGGDDDDLSDVHPRARGFIRGVREAARFKFSPVEMLVRDAARQTLPEWRASR